MEIYTYLKHDHSKVIHLMEQILATRSDVRRHVVFVHLRHDLLLHAETEEMTFYAALKTASETEEKIEEAEDDHTEIKKYLTQLSKVKESSPKWLELFGELKHAVEHHIRDEEERIFEKARTVLSHQQAKQLATQMDRLKNQAVEKTA